MRRVVIPELLDSDAGTPAEIRAGIADLGRINRWFGGVSTSRKLVRRIIVESGRRDFTLLDVAAGAGYVPATLARELAARGIRLDVTLADRSRAHLNGAARAVVAEAVSLPFGDASFDLVACGLFAHHLEPDELRRFAAEALRVCRVAVLINDLRRSAVSLALVYAGLPLFRSRLTWHDAPASVRRSYTLDEMRQLLNNTGASRIDTEPSFLFRMGIVLWRK